MTKTTRKVLDPKDKAVERDAVKLEGKEYDLKTTGDLKFNKDIPELLALSSEARIIGAEEATEDTLARMRINLRRQMEIIFYDAVPDEVFDNMSIGDFQQVVDFFIERPELRA